MAFVNQKHLTDHHLKFYDSFVDLKVVGWKSYSKALNDYTKGFHKATLEKLDESVEHMGDTMKSSTRTLFTV